MLREERSNLVQNFRGLSWIQEKQHSQRAQWREAVQLVAARKQRDEGRVQEEGGQRPGTVTKITSPVFCPDLLRVCFTTLPGIS